MKLKDFLKQFDGMPDDLEVIVANPNTMEQSGYSKNMYVKRINAYSEKRDTYDAFDYEPYSYEYIGLDIYTDAEKQQQQEGRTFFDAVLIR